MIRAEAAPRTSRIPKFVSREEEAEFWDTHDITDYLDELEPVEVEFADPLSETVILHIDVETMDEVRALAEAQGFPPDVLLQIWILERRDVERRRRDAPTATSGESGAAPTP